MTQRFAKQAGDDAAIRAPPNELLLQRFVYALRTGGCRAHQPKAEHRDDQQPTDHEANVLRQTKSWDNTG